VAKIASRLWNISGWGSLVCAVCVTNQSDGELDEGVSVYNHGINIGPIVLASERMKQDQIWWKGALLKVKGARVESDWNVSAHFCEGNEKWCGRAMNQMFGWCAVVLFPWPLNFEFFLLTHLSLAYLFWLMATDVLGMLSKKHSHHWLMAAYLLWEVRYLFFCFSNRTVRGPLLLVYKACTLLVRNQAWLGFVIIAILLSYLLNKKTQ